MKDLIQYISEYKNRTPDTPFIITDNASISYKQAYQTINSLAKHLQDKYIAKNPNIGILLPDCPEFIYSYYSILQAGGIVVLLPLTFKARHLHTLIKQANVNTLIYSEEFRTLVTEIENIRNNPFQKIVVGKCNIDEQNFSDFTASHATNHVHSSTISLTDKSVVIFTSSISGLPKGINLSQENIISNILSINKIIEKSKQKRFFGSPSLYHSLSHLLVMNTALVNGGSLVLSKNKKSESFLNTIKEKNISILTCDAVTYKKLSEFKKFENFSYDNLEFCLCFGSPMSQSFIEKWEEKFGCAFLEGYGLSEASIVSMNRIGNDRKFNSIGRPLQGVEIKLVDEEGAEETFDAIGELLVSGKNVMHSYLVNKDSHHSQWFATGDLVIRDIDGFLFFVGRKSDLIHKNGFLISPKFICDIIIKHPKIEEIFALKLIGEKDNSIKLCIVPKKGIQIKYNEILDYSRKNLPRFLCPDFIEFYNELPRDKLGKIKRNELIKTQ